MEQKQDLADYRARLLNGLKERICRLTCGPSEAIHDDSIQVFVNEQRVGWLSGKKTEAIVRFHCQGRVDHVGLRSEDGVLLGGLLAPEEGVRFARVPLRRDSVELSIHNTARGGSVSAVYRPAPDPWGRFVRAMVGAVSLSLRPFEGVTVSGARAAVLTQAVLVVAVLGLAADRFIDRMSGAHAPMFVTRAEVAKLEQHLDALARAQAEAAGAIQSQQQGMAQLQSAIAGLSSVQEAVSSGVMTVKKELEQRQRKNGRDVEWMAQLLMTQAQTDQRQLEAEIRSMAAANEKLSKEMAKLMEQHQNLIKKLKVMEVDVSKNIVSQQETIMMVQQNDQSASSAAQSTSQPFLFWVHFNEGTTEEHIDQWVHDMHGRKGAVNEGWQEVQVMQLTLPVERFLEQVKEAKIVKAVRVAR